MHIEYTVRIWKEGDQFVAHAVPLDVMSSGRTADEARGALDEAVHLFLGDGCGPRFAPGYPR